MFLSSGKRGAQEGTCLQFRVQRSFKQLMLGHCSTEMVVINIPFLSNAVSL